MPVDVLNDTRNILQHVVNRNDLGEFLSGAAEVYVLGKESFFQHFEPFLGTEKTDKLCEGVKRELFRGKEY